MQNFITAVMTVLGTVLVLAGIAVIVVRAAASGREPVEGLTPSVEVGAAEPVAHAAGMRQAVRLLRVMRRIYPSDRLIAWGIVLLLLAAAAAGLIGVDFRVSTTGR